MNILRFMCMTLLFFIMSSCHSRFAPAVDMPPTPILTAGVRYAVVVNSYVPVCDTPYGNSVTIRYLRCGDVEKVRGTRSVVGADKKSRIVWLKLSDGWVPFRDTLVFDRESQAITASMKVNK